jgi:predicted phage terminase large subunit-like protein
MKKLIRLNTSFKKQLDREYCDRKFSNFVMHTMPTYKQGWFNQQLCEVLQKFYNDVEAGKQPRVIIQAPPRHGKSQLVSRQFPAWCFGQNPNLNIIASSYSSDLAKRMNRDVQRVMEDIPFTDAYGQFLPSMKDKQVKTSDLFELVSGSGAYRSSGVGTGITGMGADIGIIDDPVKDAKEANSETVRNSVWEWYTSTFYTRLSPKSGVLLCMTRWHEDDLAGRLIAEMSKGGDQWEVISFPAIAEEDEPMRKKGEALHPERYPVDNLDRIKRAVGTQVWNALYQQRPSSKGGDVIQTSWFNRYKVLPRLKSAFIVGDTAQKKGQANDYSVFMVMGEGYHGGMYVIDLIRGKWEAPELTQKLKDIWSKYSAEHSLEGVYLEDKSSGTGLIQTIQSEQMIPIKGLKADADKYTRLLGVQGYIESGYVYLPDGAPWLLDFLDECEKFTKTDSHKHDDQVDTLVYGLIKIRGSIDILDIL